MFLSGLAELAKHPVAHSSRGIGLIGALEIKPWADAKPGDAALAVADAALEAGVITRNIGEAVCFCPPLIITRDQADFAVDTLEECLKSM